MPLNQGFDKRGFVWYTNFESRKSQEMSHNPYGALSFWWSEVQRAVRIEGVVCKVNARAKKKGGGGGSRSGQVGYTRRNLRSKFIIAVCPRLFFVLVSCLLFPLTSAVL